MDCQQRLIDLRTDADKTQAEIANLLNTTQSYYSQYETGKRKFPMEHAVTLAQYYKVSVDYLLGLTDDPKGSWLK